MDMRISTTQSIFSVLPLGNIFETTRKSRAEERNDSLAISNQAMEYNFALRAVKTAPDIRVDRAYRIKEIKNQIKNNEYNVSSADISEKMVGDYLENVSAKNKLEM